MEKIIKQYQDRLNDISRRNRAIRLGRIVQRKVFDLSELDAIKDNLSSDVLNVLFDSNKTIELIKTNVSEKDHERILKNIIYLKREMDFTQKEKGFFECYLGYPFIEGNFNDGTFFRAPLFLVPVEINNNRSKNSIEIKALTDTEVVINKTFFLAFNKYNKGKVEIDLTKFDELDGLESKNRLEWITKIFNDVNIELDSTSFTFKSNLEKFNNLRQDEFPKIDQKLIHLKNYAIIGEFQQLNSTINYDYDQILANNISNDMFEGILGNNVERDLEERFDYEKIKDYPEKDNYFITLPDISQEKVLVKSRNKKGLVIHGPPGTGKSQVITNLIAENMLNKKRTLLICEKKAALDVVNNRLASKDLSKNCVLVHDSIKNRNEIFGKMLNSIENLDDYDSLDSLSTITDNINLKNKFIEDKIIQLKRFIDLMHEKQEFGTSLYKLYRLSKQNELNIELENLNEIKVNFDQLNEFSKKISRFFDGYKKYESTEIISLRKRFSKNTDEKEFNKLIIDGLAIFKRFEKKFYTKEIFDDIKKLKLNNNFKDDIILGFYDKLTSFSTLEKSKLKVLNPKWWVEKNDLKEFRENLEKTIITWEKVNNNLKEIDEYLNKFSTYFQPNLLETITKNIVSKKTNITIFKKLKSLIKDLDEIIMFDVNYLKLNISEKEILVKCMGKMTKNHNQNDLESCIKNSFYLYWINNIEKNNYWLKEFSNDKYLELIKELNNTIKQKIELIPILINSNLQATYSEIKWEGYDGDGRRKNYNTLRNLIHELEKKRKRLTLRELCERFESDGLFKLFPCWMCSPEVASSIFKMKKNIFDVVIFDEASQCRLEKAIPTILRGKTIIVAGDEKQLPPTTFFKSFDDDIVDKENYDYDEKQLLEDGSLLVRAKTVLDGERLLYHYRSNYEELINFSNQMFYNSRLKVIPKNEQPKEPPIKFTNVKGTWENRQNIVEAKEVVKLIKKLLMNKNENPTIGVITFNQVQQNLIQDLLEEEASKDKEFGNLYDREKERIDKDEFVGLFVKNIENVQGDERDIIIFSISYGFDNSNKFRYSFGPLSGEYGPNRLNVAISRAKEKIYVINSFEPNELKYTGTSEGPILLKKYLEYCKLISESRKEDAYAKLVPDEKEENIVQDYDEYDSDFEGEIRDALVSLGYKLKTQVGCKGYRIDLAVVHPKKKDKFVIGIECDGAKYHSSKSAKDRDIYRQEILEHAGWKITRIWSRDWWKNPEKEIKRIDREIKWELKRVL
jgi:superfamily I DNA and/or RNA helicase/very-short-patch-repair endonuclease